PLNYTRCGWRQSGCRVSSQPCSMACRPNCRVSQPGWLIPGWNALKRFALVAASSLMACLQCFALGSRTAITQYAHIPWRVGERGLEATPQSIAQTEDGYIWVGTKLQPYRFDGIRFAPVEEVEAYIPHAEDTRSLFVASDGSLYISSRSFGVFRW